MSLERFLQHYPIELHYRLAEFLPPADLLSLTLTSRYFQNVATPILYQRISLTFQRNSDDKTHLTAALRAQGRFRSTMMERPHLAVYVQSLEWIFALSPQEVQIIVPEPTPMMAGEVANLAPPQLELEPSTELSEDTTTNAEQQSFEEETLTALNSLWVLLSSLRRLRNLALDFGGCNHRTTRGILKSLTSLYVPLPPLLPMARSIKLTGYLPVDVAARLLGVPEHLEELELNDVLLVVGSSEGQSLSASSSSSVKGLLAPLIGRCPNLKRLTLRKQNPVPLPSADEGLPLAQPSRPPNDESSEKALFSEWRDFMTSCSSSLKEVRMGFTERWYPETTTQVDENNERADSARTHQFVDELLVPIFLSEEGRFARLETLALEGIEIGRRDLMRFMRAQPGTMFMMEPIRYL